MYRVAKGGAITVNSFLKESDREIARDFMLKTASSTMREAAKIGLQSLYADPKEVLEKYKDFDIVKEMQARKGAKLLWVRARAIDADIVNANGDYFSKAELLKEIELKGQKIPAYKTFEGVPIYTNHKNDDIEQAKGMVVYAEWDDDENCVYCTFFVDEEAYPDIARNIRTGVIHDVSMGASVDWGICSECGNKAYVERDYCDCLKKYKGKTSPKSNKKVYEENYNVKFIELSCVGDGAFEACEIQEIYDVDDVLDAAQNLEKKANQICSNIVLAHNNCPSNVQDRYYYEQFLRVAESTAKSSIKLAQNAGTLVGGPLLAAEGANQNSTVLAVLTALGIDPRSGLNVLDLINLSLNFLEVAVMNMFARKDNVDLGYVQKITKSMADLQGTMQDIIDEGGVDVGGGQQRQPLNQQQLGAQQQQQQSNLSPNVGLADYTSGSVGKIMEPILGDQANVGGGVALAHSNVNLVWASTDGKREVFASSNYKKLEPENKFVNFVSKLVDLKSSINDDSSIQNSINNVIRLANERNKNIKTNTPKINQAEGINQMDHFAKIAAEQRKKLAAAVTIDFKVEDNAGNRVVLSTDGSITGFTNGKKTDWDPILTENQINMMEGGNGSRVAAELLKDYSGFIKTASNDKAGKTRDVELEGSRTGLPYKSLQDGLSSKHSADGEKTREEELAGNYYSNRRKETDISESSLENAGLYGWKVIDKNVRKSLSELIADVQKGSYEDVMENLLAKCRNEGTAKPHVVMSTTVKALARAVVSAMETPDHIVKTAQMLSEEPMLPEMIGAAAAGNPMREEQKENSSFFGKDSSSDDSVSAILKQLGSSVSPEMGITPSDLAQALSVAASESEITKEGIGRLAELLMGEANVPGEGLDVDAIPSKNEELKSALMGAIDADETIPPKSALMNAISAAAQSTIETGVTPDETMSALASMTTDSMIYGITKAKTETVTSARLRSRARREFWGVKTASTKDIAGNIIGWLADYSTNFNIPTKTIVVAAKRFAEDPEMAERIITKAIEAKINSDRTAGMKVTKEKSESFRFQCTVDDLDGMNPSDEGFDEAFKQKAIQVLQERDYHVDPSTFSFTDLCVFEDGRVEATVSTRSSKTFDVGNNGVDNVAPEMPMDADVEVAIVDPIMMTDAARIATVKRRNDVLKKYAQMAPGMGAPMGAPMGGAMGAGAAPMAGMEAGAPPAGGDLGLSSLTGGPDMADDMDAVSEPGVSKPWGSICPSCGSDDTDVSNGEGACNNCKARYTIHQSIELKSQGEDDMGAPGEEDALSGAPDAGMGGAAMGEAGLGAATAPAPMAPMASKKSMFRLATTLDSDVYLKTASPDFNRDTEAKLPLGMVCPKCGNRKAHKVKNNTFCYDCGTYAKTEVKANKKNPSLLDATITWID